MGSLKLVLRRGEEAVEDMPEVTENDLLDPPTLTRPSWLATVNEVQIQYPQRVSV